MPHSPLQHHRLLAVWAALLPLLSVALLAAQAVPTWLIATPDEMTQSVMSGQGARERWLRPSMDMVVWGVSVGNIQRRQARLPREEDMQAAFLSLGEHQRIQE